MIDPFAYWNGLIASWQMTVATGLRAIQTVAAVETVVTARTGDMRDAVVSPATADYGELSRMVPEKLAAFGQSGAVLTRAWLGVQSAWWEQAQAAGRMMTAGRPPTPSEIVGLWSGAAQATLATVQTGARAGRDALDPVARTVTANARRLQRRSA